MMILNRYGLECSELDVQDLPQHWGARERMLVERPGEDLLSQDPCEVLMALEEPEAAA